MRGNGELGVDWKQGARSLELSTLNIDHEGLELRMKRICGEVGVWLDRRRLLASDENTNGTLNHVDIRQEIDSHSNPRKVVLERIPRRDFEQKG